MNYEITFGDAKPLKFAKAETLLQWIEEEMTNWSWLQTGHNAVWKEFNQVLSNIKAHGDSLLANPEDQGRVNNLHAAVNNLQSIIDRSGYIYSKSSLATFIFSEKEGSEIFAGMIALIATRPPNQNIGNTSEIILAMCALSDFQRGISKRGATASVKTSERVRADLDALIKSEVVASDERIAKLDNLIKLREQKTLSSTETMAKTLGQQKSNTRDEQQKLRTETTDKIDKLVATAVKELADVQDLYENKMALQAPIGYWRSKSVNHRRATILLAALFIIYSITAGGQLFKFISGFEGGIEGFIAFWKDASISAFASFAGLVGLGMVFARILYRLFTSQLHLWNDARERVVMIQTYLAMAQKDHVKEEFLGALLHRLFSPSSDGIVKSDIGSVSLADMLMNKMGNS